VKNLIRKYTGKFLNYYEVNGWEFCSRKKIPYRDGNTNPDAVVIVPIFAKRGEMKIACINEYRAPMDEILIGLPAGLIDDDETAVEAAVRELKEETGLTAKYLLHESPLLFSSEGLTDESVKVVYLLIEGEPSNEFLEDGEDIETVVLTREKAQQLLSHQPAIGKLAYFILMDFISTGFNWAFSNIKEL